ncbi:type II secretion system F family protein [Bradyrhizobium lablabi]|uniref:type II secretion system F family protein n=1 Tax=Bradyrhizobium lablabi TaxID=722472 RepID=UPI001BA5A6B6|nr:type II secretion system F family protein [Bradyrhizobium lablabi]MBR1122932.1 type II secretion system F family protein [Bradyrhizobium lablabi]
MQTLALAFLAAVAVGGIAWVFIYPLLSGEKQAEARRVAVAKPEPPARRAEAKNQRSRREQVEGSLRELEARAAKDSKVSLETRLTQAGLSWSPQKFMVISAILGAIAFAAALVPALTKITSSGTAPVMVDAESTRKSIELAPGGALVIDMRREVRSVRTDHAKIANVSLRSGQQIYVTAVGEGKTSIVAVGPSGQTVATYDIFIASGSLFGSVLAAIGMAFAAGFGLPRWLLKFLKKRREEAFLKALPDAVDVIVRGIKAGLPLFESIKVVANEAPEPLRSEFIAIIETQAVGMPLGDACARLYERMPVPEANFFGIVIAIQQKSGGNLSEALGNLSKVLRDRKKMKEKIQAMSMEAKASAGIIGALPPIVMVLVYLTTPDYISLLWTHPTGQLMLVGCVIWMSIGVMVMKKMINFDF